MRNLLSNIADKAAALTAETPAKPATTKAPAAPTPALPAPAAPATVAAPAAPAAAEPAPKANKPAKAAPAKRAVKLASSDKPKAYKPAPAKPEAAPVVASDKPAQAALVASDAPKSRLAHYENRDRQYIETASYPAQKLSATDEAYFRLFATFAKASANNVCNVAAIDDSNVRPAGIAILNNRARLRRLHVLGHLDYCDAAGNTQATPSIYFRFTAKAQTYKFYTEAKARV